MAKIPQYTDVPTADTLRSHLADASPADFGGSAGVMMGEAERQAGAQIYDVAQQQEVSQVRAQLAQKRAQWTVELQNRANSPDGNSPDFADRFNADFDNDIARMGDHYYTPAGRRAFAEGTAELTSAMGERAGAFQAQAAGARATSDFKATVAANGTALVNDPSQLNSVMRDTINQFNDPDGPFKNVPAEKRGELLEYAQREVSKAAAMGAIRIDPQQALDDMRDGKYSAHLKPEDLNALEGHALVGIRAQEMEQYRRDRLEEKAKAAASQAAENSIIKDVFSDNPKMTAQDIANNDALLPQAKLTMLAFQERSTRPDPLAQISHDTTMRMFDQITLPDGDPRKMVDNTQINKEFIAGHLKKDAYNWLSGLIAQAKTPEGDSLVKRQTEFMKNYGAQLDKSTMLNLDGEGKARLYNFSYYVNQQVEQAKKDGKNPHDLFDPSKPEFLGKPEIIQSFQAPLAQQAKNLSDKLRAATQKNVEPRKPGESVADYLKRTAK